MNPSKPLHQDQEKSYPTSLSPSSVDFHPPLSHPEEGREVDHPEPEAGILEALHEVGDVWRPHHDPHALHCHGRGPHPQFDDVHADDYTGAVVTGRRKSTQHEGRLMGIGHLVDKVLTTGDNSSKHGKRSLDSSTPVDLSSFVLAHSYGNRSPLVEDERRETEVIVSPIDVQPNAWKGPGVSHLNHVGLNSGIAGSVTTSSSTSSPGALCGLDRQSTASHRRGSRIIDIPSEDASSTPSKQPKPSSLSRFDRIFGRDSRLRRKRTFSNVDMSPPPPHNNPRGGGNHGATCFPKPSLRGLVKDDYCALKNHYQTGAWKGTACALARRQYWKWYAILVVIIIISILISAKHVTIITHMRPVTMKMKKLPGGFMIPIALLIIVSFPPLVGHEIIGILVGIVYGLWIGFAILCAGTFAGELATWFAFKGCCTARADKFKEKNRYYAALTQLIREKSFLFVLVLRFSAIPGHITTAISASAGANFLSYCAAAILTLPKQLALVYLGTAFISKSTRSHVVSVVTMLLTLIGTGIAAVYIYYQMRLYLIRQTSVEQAGQDRGEVRDGPEMATIQDEKSASSSDSCPPPYDAAAQSITIDLYPPKHSSRRPFVLSNSSRITTSPVRSKSLPHAETQEMATCNVGGVLPMRPRGPEIQASRSDLINITTTPSLQDLVDIPSSSSSSTSTSAPSVAIMSSTYSTGRNRSETVNSSASLLPRVSEIGIDDTCGGYVDLEAEDERISVRGMSSMDLWRPIDVNTGEGFAAQSVHFLSESCTRARSCSDASSKKSIADDPFLDISSSQTRSPLPSYVNPASILTAYPPQAYRSGRDVTQHTPDSVSKRAPRPPEYGRSRGESSAALIGKPDLD